MKKSISFFVVMMAAVFCACKQPQPGATVIATIAQGQMPSIAKDRANSLHLVYGNGDSIFYRSSFDAGSSFSPAMLVGIVPGLYDFASRGPQIACASNGITIIASNKQGNIYSFLKENNGWVQMGRVNDLDTVGKEGLMALSGDGDILYATWLDIRGTNRNKIVGAASYNGGKTWLPNTVIYASPDSTVCECCKPSVAVKGNNVFVMFRNNLHGNRDLYLAKSVDGGKHFGAPGRLGSGNWPLNGCPMDGGGLAINEDNVPQTVWRRHDTIFACGPGNVETELGKGLGCALTTAGQKNIYAWADKGNIVCLLPGGKRQQFGNGMHPILQAIDGKTIACIWENDKQIQLAILNL